MNHLPRLPGLVVAVTVFVGATLASGACRQADTGSASPSPDAAQERQGTYGSHRFHYVIRDGSAVAIFTPVLPRDDAKVIGAIQAVVRAAFGANIDVLSPALAGQEIAVKTVGGAATYYAMLVKTDTGEVHSIRVRR